MTPQRRDRLRQNIFYSWINVTWIAKNKNASPHCAR